MIQGELVKLAGKTNKGKQVVKAKGTNWRIKASAHRVAFSTEAGPWLYVKPVNGDEKDARWVHANEDANFGVSR